MADEREQPWFVKASFGTEWGPLSVALLLEMADDGSLARDDLARCGAEGEWQPVPEVLEYLRSQHQSFADEDAPAEEPVDDMEEPSTLPDLPKESSPATPERSPATVTRRGLPGWSTYWSPATSPVPVRSAQVQWPHEDENGSHEAATIAPKLLPAETAPSISASDNNPAMPQTHEEAPFAVLHAWKRERTERIQRLLQIVADRETAAVRAQEQAKVPEKNHDESTHTQSNADDDEADSIAASRVSNDATSLNGDGENIANAMATRSSAKRAESWEQTLDRWMRSLPNAKAVCVFLLLLTVAWWFWPPSHRNIIGIYRTIYDELQTRREAPEDKTGMEDFVQRARVQLEEVIPWLEQRAASKNTDLQWLLQMGRDGLRPMLKNPRVRDSKPEVNFKKLLTEWERTHNPPPIDADVATAPTSNNDEKSPAASVRTNESRRPN